MLEHSVMAEMRAKHTEWIWNRSDTHVILGVPESHEGFKTIVEPGNSFSPGVGTYGVSTWVAAGGQLYAPEQMSLDALRWSYLEGHIPVLVSQWQAGAVEVTSRLFTDGDAGMSDIKDYLAVELHNPTDQTVELTFYLVVRSFGAAGGPVRRLGWENGRVVVNGGPVIYPYTPPSAFGALSYAESGRDISVSLRAGEMPNATSVSDDSTWASGALAYAVTLPPGATQQYDFVCHVHANNGKLKWLQLPGLSTSLDAVQAACVARWKADLPIELNVPDTRFRDALLIQRAHMAMFTVDAEPRIAPVSYPLWWLRDGAYVVNAQDKGGYHQLTERAVKRVADRDAFGGFGAEGDGPSEGIWILSEHYLMTRSLDFLREVWPHIERKADLLITMLHTDVPIKRHSDMRTPQNALAPDSDLMCLPTDDGLIMGRMDGHFPIVWINSYAYLGLTRAALCAEALGLDGSRFAREAETLRATLVRRAPELFGKNDRDPNSAFWPTGWATRDNEDVRRGFEDFWQNVRCPNGVYTPEPMWTYFEAGQAHNYMLLGQRERAVQTMEHFLSNHIAPGLYTYSEGNSDENSSLQWQRTRGWDQIRYVTPHGWTAAELFLFLRDALLREDGNRLVLGSGVPEAWMQEAFSVRGLPTHFGAVSYSYDPASKSIQVSVEVPPAGGIVADFAVPVDVRVDAPVTTA